MYTHKYNYSSVVFMQSEEDTSELLESMFDNHRFCDIEELLNYSSPEKSVWSITYITSERYTTSDEIELSFNKNTEKYHHKFYCILSKIHNNNYYIISSPWKKMGIDLFNLMSDSSEKIDSDFQFIKADLFNLIKSLREKIDNNITLSSSSFSVDGDSNVDSINLCGPNPLYSQLYDGIDDMVKIKPSRCKLVFHDEEVKSFIISLDRIGNMQFKISSKGICFRVIPFFLRRLYERGLLKGTNGNINPMEYRSSKDKVDE